MTFGELRKVIHPYTTISIEIDECLQLNENKSIGTKYNDYKVIGIFSEIYQGIGGVNGITVLLEDKEEKND